MRGRKHNYTTGLITEIILYKLAKCFTTIIIHGQKLRYSLIVTAIGMAILFGSTQIDSLLYVLYPPFGLVTISFMSLGSYQLFVGFYAFARFISQDVELRKELYKTTHRQLSLFKTIGVTEMEKEIEKVIQSS